MQPPLFDDLDGQVALVTGANRGIGFEIARGLVDLDATVYAGVRDDASDVPAGTTAVELDVTDPALVERAIDDVVADEDRLDVLVNNAGVGGLDAPLHEADREELEAVLDVNLQGAMTVTRAALPHLLEADPGRVVNLSSGLAILSDPIPGDHPAYRASKAGLNALTVSLDMTHGDDGLIANAADPGWVATELGGDEAPREPEEGAETPVWLARFDEGAPGGAFWKDRERIDF